MTAGRRVDWRWVGIAAVAAFIAGAAGRTVGAAPQTAPARSEDVLPALLSEVRGLRAALEEMASAGPRIQLSVARLQLEEGRINDLNRRLADVRDTTAGVQRELDEIVQRRRDLQAHLTANPSDPERNAIELAIARAGSEVGNRQARIAQLNGDEADLVQQITTEQGRWTAISQRLDDLERELGRK